MTIPATLAAALRWRELGASPIPVREDGSKAPAVRWKQFQTEPAAEDTLRSWFFDGDEGLGIVTGYGGVELLEFETEGAWIAWCRLMVDAGLVDELKALCDGYFGRSGGGGYHLIYRTHAPGPNEKIAGLDDDAKVIHYLLPNREVVETSTLIETRGVGGYVVVAGSGGGTHPTGRPYRRIRLAAYLSRSAMRGWDFDPGRGIVPRTDIPPDPPVRPNPLAAAPDHLCEVSADLRETMFAFARQLDRRTPTTQHGEHTSELSRSVGQGVPGARPGDAWAAVTTWDEILTPHGWRRDHCADTSDRWTRPGKSSGVSATTDYANSGLMYVFTTSTEFIQGETYTKFGAFSVLNHRGDHQSAARELVRRGFADPLRAEADTRERLVVKRAIEAEIRLEANELAKRAQRAKAYRPAPEYGSLADQRAEPLPDAKYLVDGWILDAGITLLVAQAKAGKTTLVSLDLVRALLHGEKWLERYDTRLEPDAHIGVWNLELAAARFQRWLLDAGIHPDAEKRVHPRHMRGYPTDLLVPEQADEAVRWLQERNIKVWIIDPLSKIYFGDSNKDSEFNEWWRALESVIERSGVRVCIIPHHAGHSSDGDSIPRARGTSAMIGNPDVTLVYRHGGKYGDAPPDSRRYLSAHGRDVDMPEITIDRDPVSGVFRVLDRSVGRADDKRARLGEKVASLVWARTGSGSDSYLSKSAVEKLVSGNSNEIRAALEWCVHHGYVLIEEPLGPGKPAKVRRGRSQMRGDADGDDGSAVKSDRPAQPRSAT